MTFDEQYDLQTIKNNTRLITNEVMDKINCIATTRITERRQLELPNDDN